ncbi:GTP-binding protein [Niveibacterium umoris]|nr:GTP-binding protein [Niveibacterium umoris]
MTTTIPLTLLTGFLGSGKTTLLNRLLRDPAMAGCAVLINEVGEIGLDHLLIERIDEEVVLLESGCLCCTVRGDLARALRDLSLRHEQGALARLDRVVVETTGLADPAPVIHTLMRDPWLAHRFRLDGVVATLDPRHAAWQLAQHPEAQRQIAMADRVVLTKCDIASAEELDLAAQQLDQLNPAAARFESRLDGIPPGLLQGMAQYDPAQRGEAVLAWLGAARAAEVARRRDVFGRAAPLAGPHDAAIATHVLRFAAPFDRNAFFDAIDLLQQVVGERILRLKGLVAIAGEPKPTVIHAVERERYPESTLPEWPDADHDTRLVFITRNLPRVSLEKAFVAMCGVAPRAD